MARRNRRGFSAEKESHSLRHEKSTALAVLFSMKSVLADGRNPFSWMKSLCDEIPLRGEKGRISLYDTCEVMIVAENKLADLSMDFAVKILRLTDEIQGHYALKNQLERSATSIGANIREAKYAHSKADFIAKLQISLKECFETEYWLELMEKADFLPMETAKPFFMTAALCGEC